jgi:hypothetical protein
LGVTAILGFVFDNLLLIVTGIFGAGGLMILALVWLRVLPGHDLLRLPRATGMPAAEPEPPLPPKA